MRAMRARLCALALLLLALATRVAALECGVEKRVDCGFVGVDERECGARSCCWQPADDGQPWCFYPKPNPPKYAVSSIRYTANGFQAPLQLTNPGSGSFGPALGELVLTAVFETESRVRFRITHANNKRYEVPESVLPYPRIPQPGEPGAWDRDTAHFDVRVAEVGKFLTLSVTRRIDGAVVFDLADLEYSNQFLQLGCRLARNDSHSDGEPFLYGLGQHVMSFRLPTDEHSFTMWNADVPDIWDHNIYGAHPFFMQMLPSGRAHGVFLRNSNGMDVITGREQVTFKTIGGILDFYVFTGPAPEDVARQYHALIGLPHMPPYWSMGWHQCKYGWQNIEEVQQVVADYAKHGIPLDTIWADIDYMHYWENFSWNSTAFPADKSRAFAEQLHANGQKYVPIVDPGIHNRTGYPAYDLGLEMDVFIKKGDGSGQPYIGKVWPGYTAFPDWFAPNVEEWWAGLLKQFLQTVPYDGLWIDMNEASNFIDGEVADPSLDVNKPPYHINNYNERRSLNSRGLPVDALHANGLREYDVHNLYGAAEIVLTKRVLQRIQGVRSFILSRSTFPGSGAHGAMWLGDNWATWDDMYRSIPGILSMNIFGIPMVGADVCGFLDPTNEELCLRWTALGAFYPFTRNHHHGPPGEDQEPYRWASVASVARKVLRMRYSLLPTLYTLYWRAHVQGGTVARPLFFNYPTDPETLPLDRQFMWDSSLLISPVLEPGADSVRAYFPPASRWFDLWSLRALEDEVGEAGGWQTLKCSLQDGVRAHVAGGSILAMQAPELTTTATRKNPFELLVALDRDQSAKGELFWDQGDPLEDWSDALTVRFEAYASGLSATVTHRSLRGSAPPLQSLRVVGLRSRPAVVRADARDLRPEQWSYDAERQLLQVHGLALPISDGHWISWDAQGSQRVALE